MNNPNIPNHEVIFNQPLPMRKQNSDYSPNPMQPSLLEVFAAPVTPNLPPGLEYLTTVDSVFIKQQVELLEAITGCERKNRYQISSPTGELMFNAKEDTDCCTRNCCGPLRPFDIEIKDLQQRTVIHLSRPLRCGNFCCPCCGLQEMYVYSPPGNLVGSLEQTWSIFPKFNVKDAYGNAILKIAGPFCTCSCKCGNVDFQILSAEDETEVVGKISKKWNGLVREALTDADAFSVSFPIDLNIQAKATLIGACFLMDFVYFEETNN